MDLTDLGSHATSKAYLILVKPITGAGRYENVEFVECFPLPYYTQYDSLGSRVLPSMAFFSIMMLHL
jgi:hypothetical protein